jgi:tetrahydromethanopterin S-methyltransferase subunit E
VVGIGFGVYLFFMEWDTVITFANATGIYQTTKTFRPMNWWYALIAGLMAMQSLIFMLQVVDRT